MTGIETALVVGALSPLVGKAADKAAEKLGEIFTQSVTDKGGKFLGIFGKSVQETQNGIFLAARKYVENYGERHGILKVLGMREPVSLEQVYTAVMFLGEDLRQFESIENLEQSYRQAKQRSFQRRDCKKQDGLKVANKQQFLMVLGQPGAGKSTFLRRMGLESLKGAQGRYQHTCIPVMLELRAFNKKEINLEKAIVEEFRTCGFPKPEAAVKKLLEKGKLLILLDGLDEVATDQMNDAIRAIQDFVQLHDKNRFIASCRVAAYRGNFKRFSDVAMADFDDDQIRQFVFNWFGSDAELAQECWDKLNQAEHQAAKELTQTPLLLTLICLLYQRSRKFPTNRSTLYERALRVLLEEWAAEKGIPQQEVYKGLDTKRKEMLLSDIAYKAFESDRLFIPKRELTQDIEALLKELIPEEKIVDGNAVLRAIEQQHGVLVARAESIYSFSHLTLQEYLTAQYIDDHRQMEALVSQYLTDQRWREVFQLVAGLMRGSADPMLKLMVVETEKLLISDKLKALVAWADQATVGSIGNYKSAAKRAAGILVTHSRNFNQIFNRNGNIGLEPSLDLDLDLDLDPDLDFDPDLGFSLKLRLTRHLIKFSWNARQDNYFDVTRACNLTHSLDFKLNNNVAFAYKRAFDLARARSLKHELNLAYVCHLTIEFQKLQIFVWVDWANLSAQLEGLRKLQPPKGSSDEDQQNFLIQIYQIWWAAFSVDPAWFNLSKEETLAFNQYLYANELLVRCKESAVRYSPQVWAEIEARMLTVGK